MMRMVDGVSVKDHVTSKSLLDKYNLPSVNQLAGEIKLLEAWKSIHIDSYPFKLKPSNPNRADNGRERRPNTSKIWKDFAKSKPAKESLSIDAAKLWNNAPKIITEAQTLCGAKREIKKYCKTLEV